ncbi:MAG: hypothetical protein VW338_14900 [Rhodospirillaceae bacterium]
MNTLLGVIRNQFYGDDRDRWFADQHFIRKNVVLWPATWFDERAVTIQPGRYKALLLEILTKIKHHGDTGNIRFLPGYLMKCVQDHFRHNGEAIYNEAKALRTKLDRALWAVQANAKPVETLDVRLMAQAQRLATVPRKRKRPATRRKPVSPPPAKPLQGDLFG